MKLLKETYKSEIYFIQRMTKYMCKKEIRIFDYPKFSEPFKETIRTNTERIVQEHRVEIEFNRKSCVWKESIISEKIGKRGTYPSVVLIILVMESCNTLKPGYDNTRGKIFLKPDTCKWVHYYYFIDEQVGLGHALVSTWGPFRLQFYINGHKLLASELKQAVIKFSIIDDAFDSLEDTGKALELSDKICIEKLQCKLDEFVWQFCQVYKDLNLKYHWSVMQAGHATDIMFKKLESLQTTYNELVSASMHTVKPEKVATYMISDMKAKWATITRYVCIEGSRTKRTMGSVSIKMYDKFRKYCA